MKFLNTLDSRNRPINILLWMDQANGMFGTETIIHLFLAINLESSLRDLFGLDFCKWMHFSAGKINNFYIHGGAKMGAKRFLNFTPSVLGTLINDIYQRGGEGSIMHMLLLLRGPAKLGHL